MVQGQSSLGLHLFPDVRRDMVAVALHQRILASLVEKETKHLAEWLQCKVEDADLAALLPPAAARHSGINSAEAGVIANPQFLEAVTSPRVLLHPDM